MQLTPSQFKIYEAQDVILSALKKIKPFPYVLSGGTALARFYFHHRLSEDLDFFCEEFSYSFAKIEGIVNRLRKQGIRCELVGRTDQVNCLKVASYTVEKIPPIKVDFLEDPFSGMWKPIRKTTESKLSFRVDALDQIYYRKLFSLLEQWHRGAEITRMKDLLDLYWLHKRHRSLEKTIRSFRTQHVPIDEEKIIMILVSLKEKPIQQGLKSLALFCNAVELCSTLKTAGENLLKEGLRK